MLLGFFVGGLRLFQTGNFRASRKIDQQITFRHHIAVIEIDPLHDLGHFRAQGHRLTGMDRPKRLKRVDPGACFNLRANHFDRTDGASLWPGLLTSTRRHSHRQRHAE